MSDTSDTKGTKKSRLDAKEATKAGAKKPAPKAGDRADKAGAKSDKKVEKPASKTSAKAGAKVDKKSEKAATTPKSRAEVQEEVARALSLLANCTALDSLEALRISLLGKKGVISEQLALLRLLDKDAKIEHSKFVNTLKSELSSALASKKEELTNRAIYEGMKSEGIDASYFSARRQSSLHPITLMQDTIISYFHALNYAIEFGPLIEDDFHNFTALNLDYLHPARDMQDTFYFADEMLLRTHTSPIQIRTMLRAKEAMKIEAQKALKTSNKDATGSKEVELNFDSTGFNLKLIAPGAVFRRDYDLTHSPMFHQVEGLVVGAKGEVSFANLKATLECFLRHVFGDIQLRFRSSFFPFTEPSAEVDISCIFCQGEGCSVCSHTGYLEVLGCGMVNDAVFEAVGLSGVSGFAFGLGVERFAMLRYGINDLRMFYENDFRVLEQF